jgi:hypothetical protein
MDAKVTQIGDNGEGNLRRKLVDIVDALDREIDLTWALIGLVETVCRETCRDDHYGPGLLALANRLVDGLSAIRQIAHHDDVISIRATAQRPKFSEEPLGTNTPPPGARPAQSRKFGVF